MNIFITGGKGYIGARLVEYFSIQHNVVVSSRNNKLIDGATVVQVNAATDDLTVCLKNIDIVVHLAALDALSAAENVTEAIEVNVTQTQKWLAAANKVGVKKFIYFSTVHVYGQNNHTSLTEQDICLPTHPYAITHKSAEDFTLSYHNKNNMECTVFRLSNSVGYPAGEMNQWHLLVPDLCKMAVEKKVIILKSSSNTARNFISMTTVCNAVNFAIVLNTNDNYPVYNLCSKANLSLGVVAKKIAEIYERLTNQVVEINKPISSGSLANEIGYSNQKLIDIGFNQFEDIDSEIELTLKYLLNRK